jgi:FkbM family methyltransferase
MWGIPGETITENLIGHGAFEADNARLMLAFGSIGMTIMDIGAHIGFFSALAAWIAGRNGQVHSFEPTPSTFEILSKNVESMRRYCPIVVPNMLAVGSQPGTATLLDCGSQMSSRNTLAVSPRITDAASLAMMKLHSVQVPIVTLDQYVLDRGLKPGYIKVDAESFEMEIIKGARNIINMFHSLISLEVGDCDIPGVPTSTELVTSMLDHGYVPYECIRGTIRRHKTTERYETARDLLFVPTQSPASGMV